LRLEDGQVRRLDPFGRFLKGRREALHLVRCDLEGVLLDRLFRLRVGVERLLALEAQHLHREVLRPGHRSVAPHPLEDLQVLALLPRPPLGGGLPRRHGSPPAATLATARSIASIASTCFCQISTCRFSRASQKAY